LNIFIEVIKEFSSLNSFILCEFNEILFAEFDSSINNCWNSDFFQIFSCILNFDVFFKLFKHFIWGHVFCGSNFFLWISDVYNNLSEGCIAFFKGSYLVFKLFAIIINCLFLFFIFGFFFKFFKLIFLFEAWLFKLFFYGFKLLLF